MDVGDNNFIYVFIICSLLKEQTMALVRARTIASERPPLKSMPTFVDRCRVVRAAYPYGRNLGFLERTSVISSK
jgi:hypothetical protein